MAVVAPALVAGMDPAVVAPAGTETAVCCIAAVWSMAGIDRRRWCPPAATLGLLAVQSNAQIASDETAIASQAVTASGQYRSTTMPAAIAAATKSNGWRATWSRFSARVRELLTATPGARTAIRPLPFPLLSSMRLGADAPDSWSRADRVSPGADMHRPPSIERLNHDEFSSSAWQVPVFVGDQGSVCENQPARGTEQR